MEIFEREEKNGRRRNEKRESRGEERMGRAMGRKMGNTKKKKNDRRNPCGEDELRTRGDREKWGFVTRGGN